MACLTECPELRHLRLELDQVRWSRDNLKGQCKALRQQARQAQAELRRVTAERDELARRYAGA